MQFGYGNHFSGHVGRSFVCAQLLKLLKQISVIDRLAANKPVQRESLKF